MTPTPIATRTVRLSLAALVTVAGVTLGIAAVQQDPPPVPVVTDQPVATPDQSGGSDVTPPPSSSTPATGAEVEPGEPVTRAQATEDATKNAEPDLPAAPAGQLPDLPPGFTADDINPLTGTPVITPDEVTPMPGAGNAFAADGVIVMGVPGAATRIQYEVWTSNGPGFPSSVNRSTKCASARPSGGEWYCQNGTWMPTLPGAPSVSTYSHWPALGPGQPASVPIAVFGSPLMDPIVTAAGCPGLSPGPAYICLNGAWAIR